MSDSEKVLKDAMLKLEKQMGRGIFYGLDNKPQPIERWHLQSPALNYVFGGGIPKGRIIEIYGRESHGKTLISTLICSDIQKAGGKVLYIDVEHGFDPDFASVFGFESLTENGLLARPDIAEEVLDIVEEIAKTGAIDLIVIDSIASMVTRAESEGTNSDQQMASLARVLSKGMKKIVPSLGRSGTTLICINQVREKIGGFSPYGPVMVTPGGNALKFYSSIRAEIRKVSDIPERPIKDPEGIVVKVKIKKNKTSVSNREAEMAISFTEGVDYTSQYVDFGIAKEVPLIEKTGGAWYQVSGIKINGRSKMVDFFKEPENEKLLNTLKEQVERSFVVKANDEPIDETLEIKKRVKKEPLDTISVDSVK